ncbi:MAG: glycosyltransferase [Cyanobacteriota bacterium]|nr:glycosyltransferase [Cyanobacteriota bacterium]
MDVKRCQKPTKDIKDIFVFLQVFSCEGGIQSYVQDVLRTYSHLVGHHPSRTADIFLLRDSQNCDNPFDDRSSGTSPLKFHYMQTQPLWLGRIRLAGALMAGLLLEKPDRVFCGHINLAPLIRMLCEPLGIPYTVLTYGKEVWEPVPKPHREALQHADRIWTISRYSRDLACRANHLDPDKFDLLPCAIRGELFTPAPKPARLLEQYNLHNSQVLMTVARLWSGDIYKGVDVTIRALPKILQKFPNVKYLAIGRGDDRPRLEKLAEDLGVADRVIFAGFVASEDLPDHYRVADAYIMPSQEGFGIVYLEAMATGIPVLAGDSDGSADPLQDGELGWQVPHRDPDAVAAACTEILLGGDRRCDGEWLREQMLAEFGMDAFTRHLQKLLK